MRRLRIWRRVWFWGFVGATLVAAMNSNVCAQMDEAPFHPYYEVHAGVGLPVGLGIGARAWILPGAGVEASLGTLITTLTLTGGINLPAPSLFETTRMSWSLLGSYFKSVDANWYGVTASYGLLQVGITGFHLFGRIGAGLMFKQINGVLVYPFPSFDLGAAWTFGD